VSVAVKESGRTAETASMRRTLSSRASAGSLTLLAAAMLVAACGGGSGSAAPSASDASLPLSSPSPANPILGAFLLTPKDLAAGWKYLLFDGANGLPARACDTGAMAVAKVGLQSGAHIVVEDGTLFDTTGHASAFIQREAHGHDCGHAATTSPPAQTSLALAPVGDESYSFRSQGSICDDRILFRKGAVVLELVTPCTETPAAVSAYVAAAARMS
jgi:hypothetical protein